MSFCSLPYLSFTVTIGKGIRPCCRWDRPRSKNAGENYDFDIALDDFAKDPYTHLQEGEFKKLRENQAKGEVVGCHKCYFDESQGIVTMRKHFNEMYKDIVDEHTPTDTFKQIKYIELALDNLCNLECRMCDSESSAKLYKRDLALGRTANKKRIRDLSFLSKMDLSQVDYIKILGGEPFMSPNLEYTLDVLFDQVDPSSLTLEFATNGTIIPSEELKNKLSKLKCLYVIASLDATHKVNDYQRMHGSYVSTINNMIELDEELHNMVLKFAATISIYNANYMAKTKKDIENLGYPIRWGWVYNSSTSLEHVPIWFREWLIDSVKGSVFEEVYKNFFSDKEYNHYEWHRFINETRFLDKFYNISLADYNPELAKVIRRRAFEQDLKPKLDSCEFCRNEV